MEGYRDSNGFITDVLPSTLQRGVYKSVNIAERSRIDHAPRIFHAAVAASGGNLNPQHVRNYLNEPILLVVAEPLPPMKESEHAPAHPRSCRMNTHASTVRAG